MRKNGNKLIPSYFHMTFAFFLLCFILCFVFHLILLFLLFLFLLLFFVIFLGLCMYKLVYTEERPSKKKIPRQTFSICSTFYISNYSYLLYIRDQIISHIHYPQKPVKQKDNINKTTTFTLKTAPASHEEHTGKQRRVLYI